MIKWLKNLFECKTEKCVKGRKPRRSRKRLTKIEVLAISRDIIAGKKRKDIMTVYNISTYTHNRIMHGEHPLQKEK